MSIKTLKQYAKSVNIASLFDDERLLKIGNQVLEGFREDLSSNAEWLADIIRIEELAEMKSVKKSTPLPNSANVKLPLIAKACVEFSSRVGPEFIIDGKIARSQLLGSDKDKTNPINIGMADRASKCINYQLLTKNDRWKKLQTRLLLRLALVGFLCTKTYYDDVRQELRQVLCKPDELIIPADTSSLEDAIRISHVLHWRLNDFIEQVNTTVGDVSILLEAPVTELVELHKTDTLNKVIDVIEQCTYLDLDDDGYAEPYIVTIIKDSGKVVRIVAQYDSEDIHGSSDKVSYVDRCEYYEDYHFLPDPKGRFQSVGFGMLLLHLTESANSAINQLLDAAQLANMKGGYMDARLKDLSGGDSRHDQGEFKITKVMAGMTLKDGIFPIQYGEPSSVMYQLLQLMISLSRDLTSSAEINNGTQSSENAKTGATLALQAEGKKIFNAINEGLYTSTSKVLRHIFIINQKYLSNDEYKKIVGDDPLANARNDFDLSKIHITPVADPRLSSDQQRMSEAALIQSLMQLPGIDPAKATALILERIQIPGIKTILADPNAKQPPNPEMIKIQADIEESGQKLNIEGQKLHLAEKEQIIKAHLAEAQIEQMKANALALIAKAESEPVKTQLQEYKLQLDTISKQIDAQLGLTSLASDHVSQQSDQQHQQQMQQSDQQHQQAMNQQQIEAQPNENEGSSGVPGEPSN